MKKSGDDEFLMVALAGIVGNNTVGYIHSKTKVNRAVKRNAKLIDSVFNRYKQAVIKTSGSEFPILIGSPDYPRIIRCFENIAYGLYYYNFQKVFRGECRFILGFLKYADVNTEKLKELCIRKFRHQAGDCKGVGENPRVFRYHFEPPDELGLVATKMTFYDGAEVFGSFIPEGSTLPGNLATELIRRGIKTYVKIDDGKPIEFN